MTTSIRDNLLVTAGSRIAYMDCQGLIDIPSGTSGEDVIAEFISNVVDGYIADDKNENFDEYIENAITKEWGEKHV